MDCEIKWIVVPKNVYEKRVIGLIEALLAIDDADNQTKNAESSNEKVAA